MVITFEELRHIKDSLPSGSMKKIARELGIDTDTVRNYFGGDHFENSQSISGVHFEKGVGGGIVRIENTEILDCAKRILGQENN